MTRRRRTLARDARARRAFGVLYWSILARDTTPTIRDLAAALGVPYGSVPPLLVDLEEDGLIQLDTAKGRRPSRAIRLTARGRAMCPAVRIDRGTAEALSRLVRVQEEEP